MADFPSYNENDNRPRQAITVSAPAHTEGEDPPFEEQQWRDVVALGLDKQHPLSINRDADEVTNDPYATP